MSDSLYLDGTPRIIAFRLWDKSAKTFQYKVGCFKPTFNCVITQATGLAVENPNTYPLYEGDIISFAIKGAPHGRERDECKAAHIWWCQEDGCWAFGRWTTTCSVPEGSRQLPHTYTWWYTMMDDIDRSSITLLGNIFENPELLPLLGYSPQL